MSAVRFVVDWDGTCVEDAWPEHGDWLPGAIEGLKKLDRLGDVVIFSSRVSGFEYPSARSADDDIPRPLVDIDREVRGIREMLDAVGLEHVEIWLRPYKAPGLIYIDDKGHFFDGDWEEAVRVAIDRMVASSRTLSMATLDSNRAMLEYEGPTIAEMSEVAMRTFETGATRNVDNAQPDYEGFLSPLTILEFGRYMHEHRHQADGSVRDSDNWQKGIPLESYMKSLWRHMLDLWLHHRGQGDLAREDLKSALMGILFNVSGYTHETVKAELEDARPSDEEIEAAFDTIANHTLESGREIGELIDQIRSGELVA